MPILTHNSNSSTALVLLSLPNSASILPSALRNFSVSIHSMIHITSGVESKELPETTILSKQSNLRVKSSSLSVNISGGNFLFDVVMMISNLLSYLNLDGILLSLLGVLISFSVDSMNEF